MAFVCFFGEGKGGGGACPRHPFVSSFRSRERSPTPIPFKTLSLSPPLSFSLTFPRRRISSCLQPWQCGPPSSRRRPVRRHGIRVEEEVRVALRSGGAWFRSPADEGAATPPPEPRWCDGCRDEDDAYGGRVTEEEEAPAPAAWCCRVLSPPSVTCSRGGFPVQYLEVAVALAAGAAAAEEVRRPRRAVRLMPAWGGRSLRVRVKQGAGPYQVGAVEDVQVVELGVVGGREGEREEGGREGGREGRGARDVGPRRVTAPSPIILVYPVKIPLTSPSRSTLRK